MYLSQIATSNTVLDKMRICADGAETITLGQRRHTAVWTTVNVTLSTLCCPVRCPIRCPIHYLACSSSPVWPRSGRVCNFTPALLPIALAGPGQWTEMRCVLPSSACILIPPIVQHQLTYMAMEGRVAMSLARSKENYFCLDLGLHLGWGIFTHGLFVWERTTLLQMKATNRMNWPKLV